MKPADPRRPLSVPDHLLHRIVGSPCHTTQQIPGTKHSEQSDGQSMSSRDDLRAHQCGLCAVEVGKDEFSFVPQGVADTVTRHGAKIGCRQTNSMKRVEDPHEVATLDRSNVNDLGRILPLELLCPFHELAFRDHLSCPPAADSTRAAACARTESDVR